MAGDHLTPQHHLDALHVSFDGHLLESGKARDAVAVGVEAHHLVLIDLGRPVQARIKGVAWQGQGLVRLTREALADTLRLACLGAVPIAQTASPQVSVQLRQILYPRHRRGPITLQVSHPPLNMRLLLRTTH